MEVAQETLDGGLDQGRGTLDWVRYPVIMGAVCSNTFMARHRGCIHDAKAVCEQGYVFAREGLDEGGPQEMSGGLGGP